MGIIGIVLIVSIVEGLTEFLPISSTGHMIVVGHLLGFDDSRAQSFQVFIQLGAIFAVLSLYRQRVASLMSFTTGAGFNGWNGILLLGITTLPALAVGGVGHGFIKQYLFSPITVAVGFGVGGVAILVVEHLRPKMEKLSLDALTWRIALGIGLFQCLALWPGVSRAAATIVGAMLLGVERKTAAEYSFLAAVPIMVAATAYDLYKSWALFVWTDIPLFGLGFFVAMVSAWVAITFFLRILNTHTLVGFGWYRIGLALFTLWLFL